MDAIREFFSDPINLLIIPAALIAMVFHEFAHGMMAHKLGDPTAEAQGRLSFNPLRHLDVFGTLMLIFAGFGWAKPVMVDMRYFKKPKRGMALTALAGPLTNLTIAFLSCLVLCILFTVDPNVQLEGIKISTHVDYQMSSTFLGITEIFFVILASINVALGFFNLLPIPPLDGSKIVGSFLPDRWYYTVLRYEQYGMIVLMVLVLTNVFNFLSGARDAIFDGLLWLASHIVSPIVGLFA